jgi:aminoglycoside 6'-N-acetyltransferase I
MSNRIIKKDLARKIIEAGENWAKGKGCTQLGSDVEIDNDVSYEFHL